jgi:hypothetical protein
MGKDERAISVSGYIYRGNVKYTDYAFNKTTIYHLPSTIYHLPSTIYHLPSTIYQCKARNHLVDQVENLRVGDKDGKQEDDLDTFCYGIAIALGNDKGF